MKLNNRQKRIFSSAVITFILVVLSMRLLDLPLAAWVAENLRAYALYHKTSNMPDLLLLTAFLLTSLSWSGYFFLVRQNIHDQRTLFCRVIGTVLPLSFGVKTVLKWLFGRTESRTWLSDQYLYGFHWFSGKEHFQGFPSGHMLVFTPLFLALWHFYPRFRLYYGVAWFGLSIALIATDYHFLSDVLAGAYIGAVVYLAVLSNANEKRDSKF